MTTDPAPKEKKSPSESQEDSDTLISIIRIAGKAGVSELKFGELEIRFFAKDNRSTRRVEPPSEYPDYVDPAEMGPTSNGSIGGAKTSEDRRVVRELEETQQMIDDPFAYETQQIDDQLGNSEREENGHR